MFLIFGLNNKAQSSSPFELLVAVIIMIFVILIGTQAMAKLEEMRCSSEIQKNLQNFKFALEKIVDPGTPQQLSFSPPSCHQKEQIQLKFYTGGTESLCTAACEEPRSECILLEYSGVDAQVIKMCVKIPITTWFENDCSYLAKTGYVADAISYNIPIKKGVYLFRNMTLLGEAFQRLCVFREVKQT